MTWYSFGPVVDISTTAAILNDLDQNFLDVSWSNFNPVVEIRAHSLLSPNCHDHLGGSGSFTEPPLLQYYCLLIKHGSSCWDSCGSCVQRNS